MRNSTLCELKNADVRRSPAVQPLQINAKLVKADPQINHSLLFVLHLHELLGVQGESKEVTEAQVLSHAANARLGRPGLARTAVGATPGPAVYSAVDFPAVFGSIPRTHMRPQYFPRPTGRTSKSRSTLFRLFVIKSSEEGPLAQSADTSGTLSPKP